MSTVEKSVDVNVPIQTAYNQWTQFEEFPRFMEGVKSVTQTDDTHLHWVAEIAGKDKEWDAEITEQHPDERVAWTSTSGAPNAGVVTFHRIDDETTRVTLQMDVDPEGLVENVGTAYNQWTQFEDFPKFMEGVKSVTQTDDTHLRWVAEVAGKDKEWDAEITEQHADERVAWNSTSGADNAGVVTFHRIDDETTRVTLQMDVDPEGLVENVGTALGFLERRVKGDLERFKEFIESRGTETGAWRGEGEAAAQR
jgi:uncharacterized membrane protein